MKFWPKNSSPKNNVQTGFTMIELLVVTTIIIIISTIGLVSFRQAGMNARNGTRRATLENIRSSLVLYRSDVGTYPATSDFNAMLSTISEYTSSVSVTDPVNDATYYYSYSSAGPTFTLTAYLEPDAEVYTVTNP